MLISRYIVSDTCYVLSFAIIMLNTSLHNPSVKDKPTVDRFVAMNRGINEGGDLPRELLEVSSTLCYSLEILALQLSSAKRFLSLTYASTAVTSG